MTKTRKGSSLIQSTWDPKKVSKLSREDEANKIPHFSVSPQPPLREHLRIHEIFIEDQNKSYFFIITIGSP